MKRLRVRDRVMTLHDACTSRMSRVLTIASLQQLKMEVLISAPADCKERFVITFLNAQRIAPIEIYGQLCQVNGHTWLDDQHICRSLAGRCLIIIHPIARTSRPVLSIFSYTSRNSCLVNVFRMTERPRWVSHSGSNPRRQTCTRQGYKSWSHGMTNVSILEVNILKNSTTLAVSVQINRSNK